MEEENTTSETKNKQLKSPKKKTLSVQNSLANSLDESLHSNTKVLLMEEVRLRKRKKTRKDSNSLTQLLKQEEETSTILPSIPSENTVEMTTNTPNNEQQQQQQLQQAQQQNNNSNKSNSDSDSNDEGVDDDFKWEQVNEIKTNLFFNPLEEDENETYIGEYVCEFLLFILFDINKNNFIFKKMNLLFFLENILIIIKLVDRRGIGKRGVWKSI